MFWYVNSTSVLLRGMCFITEALQEVWEQGTQRNKGPTFQGNRERGTKTQGQNKGKGEIRGTTEHVASSVPESV